MTAPRVTPAPGTRAEARCPPWAFELVHDIARKLPDVDAHLPEDQLTIAIMLRADVLPHWHFVVDDAALRARARTLLAAHRPGGRNDSVEDAVLVVCCLY